MERTRDPVHEQTHYPLEGSAMSLGPCGDASNAPIAAAGSQWFAASPHGSALVVDHSSWWCIRSRAYRAYVVQRMHRREGSRRRDDSDGA